METLVLTILIIFGMLIAWKFGFDTGWVKGFEARKYFKKCI